MEDHLSDAFAVPQMDEDDASQVMAAMHPTHQQHARARVRRPQLAASVRAPQIAQKIQTDAFRHMILAT
jgi:hypothetical protein